MLSELQEKKLTRYFRVFDVNDDGRIGRQDFERVLENVRQLHGAREDSPAHEALRSAYERRWEALREVADTDESGTVELWEWLEYFDQVMDDEARYQAEVMGTVGRMFDVFDTDEDGLIGPDEFCNFYGVYGQSASMARQVFFELDTNGDGQMSWEELMAAADTFFKGQDPADQANLLYGPYD